MSCFSKKPLGIVAALFSGALMTGCGTTAGYFPPSTPSDGVTVTATDGHINILMLTPPDDLDRVVDKLKAQCPGGRLEGISVNHTRRYWYFFVEQHRLRATGVCIR